MTAAQVPTADPDLWIRTADLVEAGIATYRQLDHWVRRGHLRLHDPLPGSGKVRLWPEAEVRVADRIARLVAAGVDLDNAARIARAFADVQAQAAHLDTRAGPWPERVVIDLAPGITLTVSDQPLRTPERPPTMTQPESDIYPTGQCGAEDCKAPIIWAYTRKSVPIPVDRDPSPDGTVKLTKSSRPATSPWADIVAPQPPEQLTLDGQDPPTLHRPHWQTCPHPDLYRRPRA